jgi:transcription elongation GreA/GreB family factor
VTDQVESTTRNTIQTAKGSERGDRSSLMEKHVAARARRDAAALGSDEYREAAEEVGRIEVAIAKLEEPPPTMPVSAPPKQG